MARAASVPGLWTLGFLLFCGVWVWVRVVFGLGSRLRPATPGWGVGVGVCLCARSACTPPLLAGVCGVAVCAWARVWAAPRHSWLGCWGVCVFVCPLRLYPGTPGWVVWCGCVCLGSGFGCAPPLLVGVLEYVCVCSCARSACTPPLLAGVCGVCVCVWARVSAAARHSWLGCFGVCVRVCAPRLYPATPGWVVRRGCVCSGSGFGCAPPLLARVLGCLCVSVPAPLVPRHSWLGCVVRVCVLGLGFRLRPATPRWGVGVCACSCADSACTPLLLAGVCGVGVCAWVSVSAAPRLSWLGCWGVCVLVCLLRLYPATPGWAVRRGGCVWARVSAAPRLSWLGCWGVCMFLCALRLYPATPGWGVRHGCVCLGLGLGCAPPLLAGVLGCVCARVPAPLVPRHSWLGCVVLVCVFGLRFRLRPATPGSVVGVCVCLCARSACTPPLLAGLCAVGVCPLAWGSAAPRHFWQGSWGVCVLVCPLRLYPATAGWGVWCGCVCLGSGFGCAPPLLAGVLGCVCVRVPALLVPRHSWLGCAVWLCVLGLGFWLRPATLGWGVGVCVCLCAALLVPRHSWLGCAAWVRVCALHSFLASPGWGVLCVCVCSGSGFGCAPPLLAGVLGCVCVCVRAPLVPRHSWLGRVAWVYGLGVCWHLFLCRGSLRVVRAAPVCGTRWPLSLGTCWCAVVLAGGVPLWRALWPRVGEPRLVRSGRSRCSGRLSRRRGAFPYPRGLRPRI